MSLTLATSGVAFAYDTGDVIRDCGQRIRDEYQLTDLRNSQGTQLGGDKHYRVEGKAKVDGDKYPGPARSRTVASPCPVSRARSTRA
jgi:hypothetical protein